MNEQIEKRIAPELQDCLNGKQCSYILPFVWYAGEDRETVGREIESIKAAGINEFLVENRGGDWFCSDFWWNILGFMLKKAQSLDMRVWLLDDSHVPTGSANDSLHKEENARYRPRNLRIEPVDVVGPLPASALIVPKHTEKETLFTEVFLQIEFLVHATLRKRDEQTNLTARKSPPGHLSWEKDSPASSWRFFGGCRRMQKPLCVGPEAAGQGA